MNDFINEEPRIPPTLEKVYVYCKDKFREFEILVVDEGRSSETGYRIKAFRTG
jgi:glycosyltransferase involved in cell wall biosynthesis